MNRDTDIYRIKKEQDHQLMVNYYTAYVIFDDLPKERDLLLEAIRHRYEAIMDKFNFPMEYEDYEFLADMPLSEILM